MYPFYYPHLFIACICIVTSLVVLLCKPEKFGPSNEFLWKTLGLKGGDGLRTDLKLLTRDVAIR